MTNDADLMTDIDGEGAFEVQMRGYSRRQVDEFVARSRSQVRDLEERGLLERTLVVDRLAQGSDTIFVQQRGIDRVEPVKGLLDFRFSKQIAAGVWHVEPVFDIYNVFNANPVLAQNVGIGSTLGVPTLILAPRVIRLSIKVNF